MITMTCLIGVVVLLSLLPLGSASAAVATIGAILLMSIAHIATPHNSLYLRRCCVRIIFSNRVACYEMQRQRDRALPRPVSISRDCRRRYRLCGRNRTCRTDRRRRAVHRRIGIVLIGTGVREIVAAATGQRQQVPV